MRILLGMSGGLDSTYAALKLKNEAHDVTGMVLRMHGYTETDAAREAAQSVEIPLVTLDLSERFQKTVVENFVSEYLKARTPNPCILCNSEVKFRALYEYATENGFDRIATGHYAEIVEINDEFGIRHAIKRGKDSKKDQSYMLWRLSEDILSKLIFPLAKEEKKDVRESAKEENLTVADRPESQEICFIPSGNYAEYIEALGHKSLPGDFIDQSGNVLGRHNGIIRYTVGQRKGLGIAYGSRIFVTDINPKDNTITLSPDDKYTDEFSVSDMRFSGIREPKVNEEIGLDVKIRYAAPPIPAKIVYLGNGAATVKTSVKIRAVTPGQSAVFYKGDLLACGGYID